MFQLYKDVEGLKGESYKEVWRWVRKIVQDLAHVKKVCVSQQKTIQKLD